MMAEARKKGVTGVPFTIIDGRWAVIGGQTAEVYIQVRVLPFARGQGVSLTIARVHRSSRNSQRRRK